MYSVGQVAPTVVAPSVYPPTFYTAGQPTPSVATHPAEAVANPDTGSDSSVGPIQPENKLPSVNLSKGDGQASAMPSTTPITPPSRLPQQANVRFDYYKTIADYDGVIFELFFDEQSRTVIASVQDERGVGKERRRSGGGRDWEGKIHQRGRLV